MGKKKVAEQTADTAIKQQAAVDTAVLKATTGKKGKNVANGKVYINSSYNNTVITITDPQGNVIAWATAGAIGFSGPKKATPFAASKIVGVLTEKMRAIGMVTIDVILKGVGGGRDSAVRSFINQGFSVSSIKDVTPIPHNGPRPPKVRRV
jgi:small subunit ribosomal protein S11